MNTIWHERTKEAINALNQILEVAVSSHQANKEYVYQYTLSGLFLGKGYRVRVEYESGYGRSDLVVEDSPRNRALVFELKQVSRKTDMKKGLAEACNQVIANKYESQLIFDGFKEIHKYGVCFWKKRCLMQII